MTFADRFHQLTDRQPAQFAGAELLPVRMARAVVELLPEVAGAGISVIADRALRIPLGASDDAAAIAERLQFTVGEGPCLQAVATGRPVFAPEARLAASWPQLFEELTTRTPYHAVLSVPLRYRYAEFGTLDLNFRNDRELSATIVDDAYAAAEAVGAVLAAPGEQDSIGGAVPESDGPAWLNSPPALRRQRVWIAIGMLSVHLDLPAIDALDALRARAFRRGQDLDEYADELASRRSPLPEQ